MHILVPNELAVLAQRGSLTAAQHLSALLGSLLLLVVDLVNAEPKKSALMESSHKPFLLLPVLRQSPQAVGLGLGLCFLHSLVPLPIFALDFGQALGASRRRGWRRAE